MANSNDDIEVSIICATYNHEKYISKALEGFVSQKTTFKYEIIIHDDASTDSTYSIISSFMEKYDNIICIHQKENQFKKVDIVVSFINKIIRGKYVAICEGDDYWHDPYKLQIMYDALESNPSCAMAVHRVACCNEDGTPNERSIPEDYYGLSGDCVITAKNIADMLFTNKGYPFHTSCFFERKNVVTDEIFLKWTDISRDIDHIKAAIMLGDVLYIDKPLSTRRISADNSWTKSMDSKKKWDQLMMQDVLSNEKFDSVSDYRFHEEISHYILNTCMYLVSEYPKFSRDQMRYVSNKIGAYNFLRKTLIMICPRLLAVVMRVKDK